jgi:tape measure domain-containing protein
MQVKDELRVLVEAEVARAIENFNKLSGGIGEAEKKTLSLDEALDSLSKKSLIISGIFGGAGIAAVKFAGENQKLQFSLKNMLGSAEQATSVFEDWRRLGSSPGLSVDEVVSLGRAMVNMGHSTEYATSTMQMLGNVTAGSSASFGEISSSFERARAMGNLTTRDLVRLQQQGIPIVKQLAKEMGTSEERIRQLAAEGKIGFDVLERAFRSMTAPGGQFAGMMDELSGTVLEKFSTATADAKQALASFGELLLPMATGLLNSASSVLNGITDMDDGTKRFILTMGGIIAVSGPAIKAIKGIHGAITLLTANPALLGIAGVAAGIGLLVTVFTDASAKAGQAARDYEASLARIARSNQNLIRNGSFEEASRQIRGLTRAMYDAARETGNFTAAEEAAERLMGLNQRLDDMMNQTSGEKERLRNIAQDLIDILETPVNPNVVANSWLDEYLDGFASEERKIAEAISHLRSGRMELQLYLEMGNNAWAEAVSANSSDAMLEVLKNINARAPEVQAEIDRIQREIAELANGTTIRPLGVSITPVITDNRKSWQEWFGEITDVDPALFGDSGKKAAQLYIDGFTRTLTAQSTISQILGEELDAARILRSQQADVQNALVELFSIDPDQISEPFSLACESVRQLVDEFQKLGEEAKKLENSLTVINTLENLSRTVQDFGKDQYDLALATMAAANATEEEIKQAEELIKTLRRYGMSFEGLVSLKVTSGLMNIFPDLEVQAARAIGNISAQLAMLSFDSILHGLSAVGEAFAKGENAAEDLKHAFAQMAQQILNQLPTLFLQAGLQLITQGQWPLGLGFIAAAGSSAIISGYVKGSIDKETNAARNAHGNAFDANGVIPFAQGGSFTNQIVSSPTYFRFGGKLGVMGEAGPEAIIPLRRMPNGDMGVASASGGAQVIVNIINKSGAEVKQEKHTDSAGNEQWDIIIGGAINTHIGSGKADRVLNSRFDLRAKGV